jgi:hypothetical protein
MTLAELRAVPGISAQGREWFACFIQEVAEQESGVRFDCANQTVQEKEASTAYPQERDFWEAFDKHLRSGTTDWKISYHFVSSPRRMHFSILLGPDGKVKEVTPVKAAD